MALLAGPVDEFLFCGLPTPQTLVVYSWQHKGTLNGTLGKQITAKPVIDEGIPMKFIKHMGRKKGVAVLNMCWRDSEWVLDGSFKICLWPP